MPTRFRRDPISHFLHEIPVGSIPRTELWDCDQIPRCRSFHSICSVSAADPTQLMVRYLSCFCVPCINNEWDDCENEDHVSAWLLKKLKPHNTRLVRQYQINTAGGVDESQFTERASQDLADDLRVGDKFVVPAEDGNEEGVLYYVLVCQRTKFVVRTPFSCVWGNDFEVGDEVVEGKYFQRWGNRESGNYVFPDGSHPAYIHSHWVKAIRFPMLMQDHRIQGGDPTHKLQPVHYQRILLSLV